MSKTVKLAAVVVSRFAHLTPSDPANVERIRADLVEGSKVILNDPHVFREGNKWELLAGHDRVQAARLAGWAEIQVRDFTGTSSVNTEDGILAHFCRENVLRKDVSKAAIVEVWIGRHPEWTDGKVALESGCSREYVSQIRGEMQADGRWQVVATTVGVDGQERPARERKPRAPKLRDTTPAKPKFESAEEMAAALTRPKSAPASPPESREKEAPELREAEASEPATGSSADNPEVRALTGATAPVAEVEPGAVKVGSKNHASDDGLDSPELGESQSVDPVGSPGPASIKPADVGGGVVSSEVRALVEVARAVRDPMRAPVEVYRAAGVAMGRPALEAAQAYSKWFAGFLLQAEIGLRNAESSNKSEAA